MQKADLRNKNRTFVNELQKEFNNCTFKRIEKINEMYITNAINKNMSNDLKIFRETQVKRILRGPGAPFVSSAMKNNLAYFTQKENEDLIYKFDKIEDLKASTYAIHNIGHATQLIQIPGFNILTDPVFHNLNQLFYPAKTKSHPDIDELPMIDFIIISHNHRDHVDSPSIQQLTQKHTKHGWPQPKLFVPKEDKKLFESFGLEDVEEVDWFSKISVSKNINGLVKNVDFISIPADHRSGRYIRDHHKALVTGWIVNPEQEDVIFKYSGDTRGLSSENQQAVDAVLWYEIRHKTKNSDKNIDNIEIPDIICLEPSGPNYTRCYMDVTHQSTSYSGLLKFVEAENLAKLSGLDAEIFLEKFKTVMIHHNKYELGPDRFNEGLFVFKKLFQYLHLNEEELNNELIRQKNKLTQNLDREKLKKNLPLTSRPIIATLPEHTSLLVHAKDFIVTEIATMTNKKMDKEIIKNYMVTNTIFMKIGERMNNLQMYNSEVKVENIQKYNRKQKYFI